MKKNDEGFTLIELLIVIVILGILATVVVFSVRGITDQGQDNACDASVKTVEVALEAYFAKYGSQNVPDQDDLDEAGLIRDVSALVTINGADTVVGTSTCA
ncbi:MAG: type II secretion system protein [Acidimicrobiia bacterium]